MSGIFISYTFGDPPLIDDHRFILQTSYWLKVQGLDVYVWAADGDGRTHGFSDVLVREIDARRCFLAFRSEQIGSMQQSEAEHAKRKRKNVVIVNLTDGDLDGLDLYAEGGQGGAAPRNVVAAGALQRKPRDCAKAIIGAFEVQGVPFKWHCADGLPIGPLVYDEDRKVVLPFEHEKRIIRAYRHDEISPGSRLGCQLINQGCPPKWPEAYRVPPKLLQVTNTLKPSQVGYFRDEGGEQHVLAQCNSRFPAAELEKRGMHFCEAGPRAKLRYPVYRNRPAGLRCGVLVSGGIAPAINAVIAGIVERHCLYGKAGGYSPEILGFKNGFAGFGVDDRGFGIDPGRAQEPVPLVERNSPLELVSAHANEGGSILGTSRLPDFAHMETSAARGEALRDVVSRAQHRGVEILYVIGGDGSMRAAHAIWETAQDMGTDLSVVGIPKTMDNDILWVWAAFGFQSAVQQSTETIRQLWTEASSNPRLCVVQLFGSESGFVVTDAAAASGKCDLFLTPETPFDMDVVAKFLIEKLTAEGRSYAVVVMAESAVPQNVDQYLGDPEACTTSLDEPSLLTRIGLTVAERAALTNHVRDNRRIVGQTPDDLRSGALKIVSRVLQHKLQADESRRWANLRMFTNEPRHLIRAIAPSSSDIIFARRLGSLAVDGAMAGFQDFMVSQWLTEYVMVPLPLVVLGRKRIPTDGAFHAAARACTGQPEILV